MKRDVRLYLEDIDGRISKIFSFVDGMEWEDFRYDDKTVSACIREIEVIGEASKQLPKEITERFDDLPWSLMAKMRDKLIHWYFDVDEEIVWKVVKEKLPHVQKRIRDILASIG